MVLASIVIAVVAATAALWFALHVEGLPATIGSAMIMGVAVCGMHYTGMYAMQAHMTDHMSAPSGAQAHQLLTPLIIGVSMVTLLLFLQVGITDIHEPDLSRIRGQRASRYWPSRTPSTDVPVAESVPPRDRRAPVEDGPQHRRW